LLDISYRYSSASVTAASNNAALTTSLTCTTGHIIVFGACRASSGTVTENYPQSTNVWRCLATGVSNSGTLSVTAGCAALKETV
jgi:hypothetical protein